MISPVHIQAILGSTRQGRFGETVAKWFMSVAEQRDDLTIELLDLRDWPLPFFNHPKAPTSGEIAPEAQKWAEKIDSADGYVFIPPEYNRGYPAVLKNALDHLWYQWNNKPLGLVGYGGGRRRPGTSANPAGGDGAGTCASAVEVTLVSARRLFDERGNLTEERHTAKVNQMLDQVVAWAEAMQPLRSQGSLPGRQGGRTRFKPPRCFQAVRRLSMTNVLISLSSPASAPAGGRGLNVEWRPVQKDTPRVVVQADIGVMRHVLVLVRTCENRSHWCSVMTATG